MGECPIGKTVDRIDNNGPYSPNNCQWATTLQQQNNTTRSHFIDYKGLNLTIAQWSRKTGIGYKCLWKRIADGWPLEEALNIPVKEARAGQGALFE